ncbi:MAG TPA: carboxypeptidase regulatory-like domain-containing protein [Terriglobia bacterium]|nr:carboxypeptidase regulatory-like domain-containing protein [Terriglobia bacterium]
MNNCFQCRGHVRTMRLVVGLLLILLSSSASAQAPGTAGSLECTITDESGAVVQGAKIEVRNAATGVTRNGSSDGSGFFRATELAVGNYEARVSQPGFAPYLRTAIEVNVGETVRLQIQLTPARISQKIVVSAEPPGISPADTSVATTVGRERIEELPVRTRNAQDFVLLAPGVSRATPPASIGGQTPFEDSGFSFGGQRPSSNSLSIDGLENNDEFSGGSRTELSPEIVQEFQVVNNGVSAEYGGASGGSLNAVTREGANKTHGDAFAIFEGAGLNAVQPFTETARRPALGRYRMGFSRGGAWVKNRTFYYVAAEQEHNRTEESSDVNPGIAESINRFLAGGAFPRLTTRKLSSGFFPSAFSETEASGKVNHQLSGRNSLMLRYAFTNNKKAGEAFNVGGLNDASAAGSAFTRDHSLVGALTTLAGEQAVNTLRFQVSRRDFASRTNAQTGPDIEISGLVNFGSPPQGSSRHREDHYDLGDTFALSRGKQLLKWGAAAEEIHISSTEPDEMRGVYIFPSLEDFFLGQPDTFRQRFGNPNEAYGALLLGGFFQNHWSAGNKASLEAGLRYDIDRLPAPFNQDTNDFSPRVGFAWSPATKWVFRAGYGIFFDRYILAGVNQLLDVNGARAFEQVVNDPGAALDFQQAGGGALATPLATVQPSTFRPDPNLARPYSQQVNLSAEYLLGHRFTLTATGLFVQGVKLSRTVNTNLMSPFVLSPANTAALGIASPYPQQMGRLVFPPPRINGAFNDIYSLQDSARSTYDGFSLTATRRVEDFTLSASYTLSKTVDDASSFNEQPQNPYDLRAERSWSLQDQRQRFVLSGLFNMPFGNDEEGAPSAGLLASHSRFWGPFLSDIELAPILSVTSGARVNPLTGLDSNRSDAFPLASRPLGYARNSLRTPARADLDLRLLKAIYFTPSRHLDLVVESFNLFNHTNISELNPVFGSALTPLPSFALPIEASSARQVEFSIDLEY